MVGVRGVSLVCGFESYDGLKKLDCSIWRPEDENCLIFLFLHIWSKNKILPSSVINLSLILRIFSFIFWQTAGKKHFSFIDITCSNKLLQWQNMYVWQVIGCTFRDTCGICLDILILKNMVGFHWFCCLWSLTSQSMSHANAVYFYFCISTFHSVASPLKSHITLMNCHI